MPKVNLNDLADAVCSIRRGRHLYLGITYCLERNELRENQLEDLIAASHQGEKYGMYVFESQKESQMHFARVLICVGLTLLDFEEVCTKYRTPCCLHTLDMVRYLLNRRQISVSEVDLGQLIDFLFDAGLWVQCDTRDTEKHSIVSRSTQLSLTSSIKYTARRSDVLGSVSLRNSVVAVQENGRCVDNSDFVSQRGSTTERGNRAREGATSTFGLPNYLKVGCSLESQLFQMMCRIYDDCKDTDWRGDDFESLVATASRYMCLRHREALDKDSRRSILLIFEAIDSFYLEYIMSPWECIVCWHASLGDPAFAGRDIADAMMPRFEFVTSLKGISMNHLMTEFRRRGIAGTDMQSTSEVVLSENGHTRVWQSTGLFPGDSFIQAFAPGDGTLHEKYDPWNRENTYDVERETLIVRDMEIGQLPLFLEDIVRYAIQDMRLRKPHDFRYGTVQIIGCAKALSGCYDETFLSMIRMWIMLSRVYNPHETVFRSPLVQYLELVDDDVARVGDDSFEKANRKYKVSLDRTGLTHIEEVLNDNAMLSVDNRVPPGTVSLSELHHSTPSA